MKTNAFHVDIPGPVSSGAKMNIDELISAIQTTSSDPVVRTLCDLLARWKNDDTTIEELESRVEIFLGNTWIASDQVHREVYRFWSEFRYEAMRGIHSMTMRERLSCFGLNGRLEAAGSEDRRSAVYAKILADADAGNEITSEQKPAL